MFIRAKLDLYLGCTDLICWISMFYNRWDTLIWFFIQLYIMFLFICLFALNIWNNFDCLLWILFVWAVIQFARLCDLILMFISSGKGLTHTDHFWLSFLTTTFRYLDLLQIMREILLAFALLLRTCRPWGVQKLHSVNVYILNCNLC